MSRSRPVTTASSSRSVTRRYRFLAAARVGLAEEVVGDLALRGLEAAPPLAPARPTPAAVRRWAKRADVVVSDRGRIPGAVMEQYLEVRARGEV